MRKLFTTLIALAITTGAASTAAHAHDEYMEAAIVTFYDKTCAKLPADFVSFKIRKGGGKPRSKFEREMIEDAQASVQDEYKTDPTAFCANERQNVQFMLDYYRKGK